MSIKANVSTMFQAMTDIVVAACTISQSVENTTSSLNHLTKAMDVMSLGVEKDAIFDDEDGDIQREAKLEERRIKAAAKLVALSK